MAHARQLIAQSEKIAFFTGAGISTPSGIPDFRSPQSGLWSQEDPLKVVSLSSFRRDPLRFYRWLAPLLRSSLAAKPNPAHISLANFEASGKVLGVITQNIDRLHQRAGSSRVIELHGSLESSTCQRCRRVRKTSDFLNLVGDVPQTPRCEGCGGVFKPDITFFEEALPQQAWAEAESIVEQVDLLVVCGSSLEVYPAASLPERAVRRGVRLVLINRDPTHLDPSASVVLHDDLAEVLPALLGESA